MTDSIIALRDKTILIAEDDEIVRNKTKNTLSMLFKRVIEAKDGEEALEKFADNKPDIVFTDIKMPNMDGLTLLEEIRKHDKDIPVVLFSSHSEQKYLVKAIKLQVQGYVMKPASLNDMLEVLAICSEKITSKKPLLLEFNNGVAYKIATNELFKNGQKLSLSVKEHAIMNMLVKTYPSIVTKEEMSKEVWPMEQISNTTIKNTISRLRAKIGHDHVVAITGIGWRLELV
jgi:two-component system, OmpR family, response regulator VanR